MEDDNGRPQTIEQLRMRYEAEVFKDHLVPRIKPIYADDWARQRHIRPYWHVRPDHFESIASDCWTWDIACSWIAWQSLEGTAQGTAAFEKWRGRLLRDKLRVGQVMTFEEALEALRIGLEAGRLYARKSRMPGAEKIPASEWSTIEWRPSPDSEVIEFDQLWYDGEVRYRRPVLLRDEVLGLIWTVDGPVMPLKPEPETKAPDAAGVAEADAAKEVSVKVTNQGESLEITAAARRIDNKVASAEPTLNQPKIADEDAAVEGSSCTVAVPDQSGPIPIAIVVNEAFEHLPPGQKSLDYIYLPEFERRYLEGSSLGMKREAEHLHNWMKDRVKQGIMSTPPGRPIPAEITIERKITLHRKELRRSEARPTKIPPRS